MSTTIVPHSLKDAPSLIERVWPAIQISVESEVERGAGRGQTLPALGGYWKGRKPLILVRACVLGALLPATDNPAEDLAIFEALMQIDDDAFVDRAVNLKVGGYARLVVEAGISEQRLRKYLVPKLAKNSDKGAIPTLIESIGSGRVAWHPDLTPADKRHFQSEVLSHQPYADKIRLSVRPEELGAGPNSAVWTRANRHLGTHATALAELVHQLGIMRFGLRPVVADTFAGGGSIPFESARTGADVYASDLNPVACMLTWGGLNIIGAPPSEREAINAAQAHVAAAVQECSPSAPMA